MSGIVTVVESAYRGPTSRVGWTTEADLLDGQRTDAAEVSAILADPSSRILVVDDDAGRGLVATAALVRLSDAMASFGLFAVRPDRQGRGMGAVVLDEAERMAAVEWHASTMCLSVLDVRVELLAWYERRGYVRTGEHQPFPSGDPRFGLPRVPDLRFAVMDKKLGRSGDRA